MKSFRDSSAFLVVALQLATRLARVGGTAVALQRRPHASRVVLLARVRPRPRAERGAETNKVLQGGPSGCTLRFVDIKLRVAF